MEKYIFSRTLFPLQKIQEFINMFFFFICVKEFLKNSLAGRDSFFYVSFCNALNHEEKARFF